jgi:hemolysin III
MHASLTDIVGVSIYSLGLLSMLICSAAYNMWPVCSTKWRLRRCDQSAIYVLIAATYTPFLIDAGTGAAELGILTGVWLVATLGVALTLAFPGRLDRLSIGVYVAMGWSVVILHGMRDIPIRPLAFQLLLAGGTIVTFGLLFHLWQKLRFQNAIWHVFVLLGVTCQYAAVITVVVN